MADLNAREVAELAGVTPRTVAKAVEEKVFAARTMKKGRNGRRLFPTYAAPYVAVVSRVKLPLPVAAKRKLAADLAKRRKIAAKDRFRIEPAVDLLIGELASDVLDRAESYREARDRYIEINEEIMGGTPVIRGTRMTVYAVRGRLDGGDPMEDLLSEYPHINREAFETALLYARTHPFVGRPGGRPWRVNPPIAVIRPGD